MLVGDPGFVAAKKRIQAIANALAAQKSIPVIASNLELIAAVATDEWWQDVTVPMLQMMRIRLRGLVSLIDIVDRPLVYTYFADVGGASEASDIKIVAIAVDRARFREKAFAFLRSHEDDFVLFKLRHGQQLTSLDLLSLEQIMISIGLEKTELDWAAKESHGLGLFVRSMVGLDRAAAIAALTEFTAGSTLTGNQIRFVELLIDQLTQRGVVDPALIYEEPVTGVAPTGPESLFTGSQLPVLVEVLRRIRESAVAS